MAREGYEDFKRLKSDRKSNSSKTRKLMGNGVVKVPWWDLHPGDIVKVHMGELVPVDMVPLYCSEPSGISYVETSSLDGEKNLKPKLSISEVQVEYNQKQ
jgi:P-type E1-E2 ATPase